jgi:hypothetical protein
METDYSHPNRMTRHHETLRRLLDNKDDLEGVTSHMAVSDLILMCEVWQRHLHVRDDNFYSNLAHVLNLLRIFDQQRQQRPAHQM